MLLKKIYNYLNTVFWKAVYEHPSLIKYSHTISKPFENISPDFEDEDINQSFGEDNRNWFHNEYIYKIQNTLIEPSNKICIKGLRTIIKETQTREDDKPSLIRYLLFLLSFKKKLLIKEAVFFDGTIGSNYFHFFSDVINKIWVIEKYQLDDAIPMVISKETFDTTYFQYFYKNTELKKISWIVQDQESWIKVMSLWFVKPYSYKKEYWNKTLDLLKICYPNTFKRVFIKRSAKAGRYITNFKEIETLLKKYDFKIVDTIDWVFDEEFVFFSQVEILIGIHGAGNTNVMFCNKEKIKFIEVFPADNISCQFYWLAETLHIPYSVIKGGTLDAKRGFYLNPVHFEEYLLKNIN